VTASLEAIQSDDLGGGFRYTRHAPGFGAIVAGALAPLGFHGLMSAAFVNARDRETFREWADAVNPGAGSRLRGVDQVHGATVVGAESLRDGRRVEADGVIATSAKDAPVVLAADCAPVWLIDPARRIVALVHAGWRGVSAGVIESGVRGCVEIGALADQLVAAVGPHLQACCFEVGPEVAARFPGHTRPAAGLVVERQRADSVALDLASAITARLNAQRVETVHISSACTRCRADILHSYRRNGKGGPLMGAFGIAASGAS
jgi:YfiH family protein